MNSVARVAKRYAQAFLNIYKQKLSDSIMRSVQEAALFLEKHSDILVFLQLSVINDSAKKHMLQELIKQFGLAQLLEPLVDLLLKHKRAFILKESLEQLYKLYHEQEEIVEFEIASSYPLDKISLGVITDFLALRTGKKIRAYTKIDPTLIAGIAMKSAVYMWESSVRKQLAKIQKLGRQ
jgi:ATP synthase F1 delta subunit